MVHAVNGDYFGVSEFFIDDVELVFERGDLKVSGDNFCLSQVSLLLFS